MTQTSAVRRLARKLLKSYEATGSWRKTSVECDVLTDDGRENPGLCIKIAEQGYEPASPELRARLMLPPIRTPPAPRRRPAWVDQAVENLKMLKARKENHER